MSTRPPLDEDDEMLAAEFALGLLEREERSAARVRAARDPAFADAVAAWEERFAPFFDEIEEAQPGDQVWPRISSALTDAPADNIVQLRRRTNLWRGYSAAMTAVAASLALVIAFQPQAEQPKTEQPRGEQLAQAPALVATLPLEDDDASLVVAYEQQTNSLIVTPSRLAGAAGHDHELWLIPASGTPLSLGILRSRTAHRMPVPAELAPLIRANASIAMSVEPTGGSPTGQPTGPVVATGPLITV